MRDYIKIRAEVQEFDTSDEAEPDGWIDLEMVWTDVVTVVGDEETAQQVWDYLIGVPIPSRAGRES